MRAILIHVARLAGTLCILAMLGVSQSSAAAAPDTELMTPPEHRRGAEQTYLTFPEWFLVHSPTEYASFVKDHHPEDFPFWGHIGQFWRSYAAVYAASREGYPFNFGYHVMIMVIGISTSVEYALRSAYETIVGRLFALTERHGMTAEETLGARVARDYVDFIRVVPWYEYDFAGKLRGLWRDTAWLGPDVLRKWERRYALTTEYGIKAAYGWLIKLGTKSAYEEPILATTVVVDGLPQDVGLPLPDLRVVQQLPDGATLVLCPRYEAFMNCARELAKHGARFREIAGNRGLILISILVPAGWKAATDEHVLFTQAILTRPQHRRVVLEVSVSALADELLRIDQPGVKLEHIYDF